MLKEKHYFACNPLITNLNISHCGIMDHHPDSRFGPTTRDHYIFNFVIKGTGSYMIDNTEYTLQKGSSFFIFPGHMFQHYNYNNSWTLGWVGFFGDMVPKYIEMMGIYPENPVFVHRNPEIIERLIENMLQFKKSDASAEFKRIGVFHLILAEIIKETSKNRKNINENKVEQRNSYVQKALDFIMLHYSENLTLSDIAKCVGLEKSYFSRLFKQITNQTPYIQLMETRMDKAAHLLARSQMSIKSVSASVGFNDSLYFSKAFKKFSHITPSQFREKYWVCEDASSIDNYQISSSEKV